MLFKFNEYMLEGKSSDNYKDYIRQFSSIYSLIKSIGGTINPVQKKAMKSMLKRDIDAFVKRIEEDNVPLVDIDKIQEHIKIKKKLLDRKQFDLFEGLDNIKRTIKRSKLKTTQERFENDNTIINGLSKKDTLQNFYDSIDGLLEKYSKNDVMFFLYGLLAYFNKDNEFSRVDLCSFIVMHDDEMVGNTIRDLFWSMVTWDNAIYNQWHYVGAVMNQLFRGTQDKFVDTDKKEQNPYTEFENAIYEMSDEFREYVEMVLDNFSKTGEFDLS